MQFNLLPFFQITHSNKFQSWKYDHKYSQTTYTHAHSHIYAHTYTQCCNVLIIKMHSNDQPHEKSAGTWIMEEIQWQWRRLKDDLTLVVWLQCCCNTMLLKIAEFHRIWHHMWHKILIDENTCREFYYI